MDEREPQYLGEELKKATLDSNVRRVRELLMKGADVNWRDDYDWTALHWASFGKPHIIKVLLISSPNINQRSILGDTALHHACNGGYLPCVKLLLVTGQCDTGIVNKRRRTALQEAAHRGRQDFVMYLHSLNINKPAGLVKRVLDHEDDQDLLEYLVSVPNLILDVLEQAVCEGDMDFIKLLVTKQAQVNKSGDTLLALIVREGKLNIIKCLVSKRMVDAKSTVNKAGQTPLSLASACGHLDIVKYLAETHHCDPRCTRDKSGQTPLSLAYSNRHLETVKYLVQSQQCDPNFVVNQEGDTPFPIECLHDNLDWVKVLISKHVDPKVNERHLLLACEHQKTAIVEYLLTAHHINPNAKDDHQRTPLSLAKNKDVIKILIQHGANAENVYTLHRKVLNNVFSKDPIKNPVRLFVIGHGGEGKSTLIEAMEHEPTFWTSVVNVFVAPKEVEGVDQRTAGIIPRVFKSRFFGEVQFFDFAGQEAYYSSHAAVIRSAVDTCPPVFILVIGLHNDDAFIIHSISYWLGIITNQCTKMEGQAPLIVVGSHADRVKEKPEIERIKNMISLSVQDFSSFELIDMVAMDCRYSNSDGMKLLRRHVEASCNSIRTNLSVNLNSHMFLVYLIDNYPDELALTLQVVKDDLEASTNSSSKKIDKVVSFIPSTIPRLTEICVQLSDKGHILFLRNEASPEKSFIIIDKTALLAKINGTMFAPKDFKQHCQLATSTGVVPQSVLIKHFMKLKINALVVTKFLSHLELAVPIEDTEVLSLVNQHLAKTGESAATSDDGYLFCPALIRLDVPPKVFSASAQADRLYRFGWLLSCIRINDFFDARFLHVLLLRLALSLGLAPVIDPDFPALQRQCSVWKTGVYWNTPQGAEVLVEVVNRKRVALLVRDRKPSSILLQVQSRVIQKVLETVNQFCSSIITEELLLSNTDVVYPLNITPTTALFSIKSLAKSVVEQEPFVVSTNGTEQLPVSDHEVYANLGENILQPLFNENDPVHTKRISDRFLSTVSSSLSKNPQLVNIICSAIDPKADVTSQTVASIEKLEAALKSWRDGCDGTYKSLRHILDQHSVFAGKSPLKLAGVQYKDFNEKLLPEKELITSQPSTTAKQTGAVVKYSGEVLRPCLQQTVSEHFSSDTAVKKLKREYGIHDEQLNTKIREENIYDLAGCFDCVETYLDRLGLSAGQQTQVEDLAERRDVQTAMTRALKFWRQPEPWMATYRTLLQILLDLKRGDVAVRVCEYIKQEVPKQKRYEVTLV